MYNKKSLAVARLSNFGWKMGFEPTTFGTTIRHSNRLSYIHHLDFGEKNHSNKPSLQPPFPALIIDSLLQRVNPRSRNRVQK